MTSSEAYVHARFADGTFALVGRYLLHQPAAGRSFGEFAYAGSWLRNEHGRAFPLDPLNLPLTANSFTSQTRGNLPGVLADATPDRWGRRILEARYPGRLKNAADWLLATGPDRAGCLAFSEGIELGPQELRHPGVEDLSSIADAFERIAAGRTVDDVHMKLFRAGPSLGGARPKAVVACSGASWIAKFSRTDDDYDQCGSEHAAMRLADACGITVAETRLEAVGARRAVLIRRFDRGPAPSFEPSAHVISALSLLGLDDTSGTGSYPEIANVLHRVSADRRRDQRELFRRMVFNVLVGNRDDHLKNHALLYDREHGWRLSPAYDIVPQPDMDPQQAIGVGRSGVYPSLENCLSRVGDFGLEQDDARSLVEDMIEVIKHWRGFFRERDVQDATVRYLERAFRLVPGVH